MESRTEGLPPFFNVKSGQGFNCTLVMLTFWAPAPGIPYGNQFSWIGGFITAGSLQVAMAVESGTSITKQCSCKVQCHMMALLSNDTPGDPSSHRNPRSAWVFKQEEVGVLSKQAGGWVHGMLGRGRWSGAKEYGQVKKQQDQEQLPHSYLWEVGKEHQKSQSHDHSSLRHHNCEVGILVPRLRSHD